MKKPILLLFVLCAAALVQAQNIITVNNQPSFDADFTSLQTALDSAQAGDIIMLHGSSTSYGSIQVRKRVVIIGPGYLLGENDAPYTQANPLSAQIANLTFVSNANGSWDASGSLITGVTVTNTLSTSVASQTPINFTIQRCKLHYTAISNYVTAIFKENYFDYNGSSGFYTLSAPGINNIQLYNNIIRRVGNANMLNTNDQGSGIADHNVFVGEGSASDYNVVGVNFSFTNNLFLGDRDIVVSAGFGQVANNISNGATFEGIPSNLTDVNGDDLVIGWSESAGLALDERFRLADSSPALNAGSDGDHVGAFTQQSSYVLSGIPFVPNIYALDAPDFGTTGSGITVNIKAKANN